ncbi:right-handed parallel beta-helix repeat-containing protein [candidate division KSB1 bacterium]|nr:MAG: right-handed parallel beta-helix repeat-containing protein [candidate division KSB1 bacterium]
MKSTLFYGILFCSLLALLLAGCSEPTVTPPQPVIVRLDGTPLNTASDVLAPVSPPYILKSDWIIEAGRTVTIQPGTEIMVDSLWWIDVRGQMIARGTPESPIVFTSSYIVPDLGQWRGIKLRNGNPDQQSVFEHCIFKYGAYFDLDTTKRDVLEDSVVEANTFRGMLCVRNSRPIIERCVVMYNQNNAVFLSGSQCAPRIRYNIFWKNDASGVRADLTAPVPQSVGQPNMPDVSYNCVSENSALNFLYGIDSTLYGRKQKRNANLDSCDFFYNINLPPLMNDPLYGDLTLQSCSPCVDAGPVGEDLDPDGTRPDMGSVHYVQVPGELRGLIENDTLYANVAYRMSCHAKIDSARTIYVEPGTQIEVTGLYTFEVEGRLVFDGTAGNRIRIHRLDHAHDVWGGFRFRNYDSLGAASVFRYTDIVDYQQIDIYKPGLAFEGCLFENGFYWGVLVQTNTLAAADTTSFSHCTFRSCGQAAVAAFASAVTVRNTVIENSSGHGIWLTESLSSSQITNCIVRDNRVTGLSLEEFSSPLVVNNVFLRNDYFGLYMKNNCLPQVYNNVIYDNGRYGIYAQFSSTPTLRYNDVYGHFVITRGDTSFYDMVPGTLACESCLRVNPAFTGETDQRLAAGSPCIDAGDPSVPYNDADGSRNDIGAYGGPAGTAVGAIRAPAQFVPLASK